jgi:hypothetical protein
MVGSLLCQIYRFGAVRLAVLRVRLGVLALSLFFDAQVFCFLSVFYSLLIHRVAAVR